MSAFHTASSMASLLVLVLAVAIGVGAVPQLDKTYWNSNWNTMYFEIDGNKVVSEYIHDEGVISATLSGDTLRGFWRELNNPQTCGPEGKWSGRVALLFDSTGKAFTGDWDYCTDSGVLDLRSTRWAGTWRAEGYNEAECGTAGRNWCDGKCQIQTCGGTVTEPECLATGRFWCGGTCSLTQCPSGIRRWGAGRSQSREALPDANFDLRGRSLEVGAGRAQGWMILRPSNR